ncbi:hypothetical protein GFM13_34890 [Rhizobium leguminosarum bv. viciae]|nr:hypothetical protein [Rhizobium leguminosarum bv. viciae]
MTRPFSGSLNKDRLQLSSDELEEALFRELRLPAAADDNDENFADSGTNCVPLRQFQRSQQNGSSMDPQQKEDRQGLLLECVAAAFLFCVVVVFYYSLLLVIEEALPFPIFHKLQF